MYLRYVLSAAAIFCLAGVAKADYSLEFANSLGVAQSAFMGNSGSSLTIQVYLTQSSPGQQVLTTNGLSTAGVQLNFTSSDFSVTAATPNTPQFAYNTATIMASSTSVQEAATAPVVAPTVGANANRILLGTFTFTLNSSGTITTSFPSGGANDVDGMGNTLDSYVTQSTASVYVISVPEPGSMALTGLAGTLIGVGAWRKRRKSLAAQVA